MATKKRRLLPSLDELEFEAKRHKAAFSTVHESFKSLSEVDLFSLPPAKLRKFTSDEKLSWLITRYSFDVVAKLCSSVKVLPSTLTENQKVTILQKDLPQLSLEVIKVLLSFVTNELSDTVGSFTANRVAILAPPVGHCYDCQQPLSSYGSCQVKCYTTNGAVKCEKFTLRCTECKLLYNYAQFGNKHDLGFRYYPLQREFVEASDTTYIERNLLELQCSLA